MKLVKIIFAGTLVWTVSLIWPNINQWLTQGAMLLGVAGLGSLIAGYVLVRVHRQPNDAPQFKPHPVRRDLAETRPFTPIGMA